MVDDFINRKHGRTKITYHHPTMEPILRETYGVIVYQEQVMQIARALAGYSLGGADLLRRAMGKRKRRSWRKKAKFLDGAKATGVDPKIADGVFDLMAAFAGLSGQQVALRRLWLGHLSDRVLEAPLPGRVLGRHPDLR